MKITRYNYWDLYKYTNGFKTRELGLVKLINDLYKQNWREFHNKKRILDTTRWVHYIGNIEVILNSGLSVIDKAVYFKIATYREYSDYMLYGDLSIDIERIEDISMLYIKKMPYIKINNDKLTFTFEEK